MKVMIATECGGVKGMGHLTRCLGIAQGFQEKKIPVKLLLEGEGSLEDLGIEVELCNWIDSPELLFDCDSAIIDSYTAPLPLYQLISEKVKKPVFIDDYNRLPYPKGTLINGNAYGATMPYKQNALLGLKYTPLRKAFWDCEQNPLRESVKKIFVTMGGTDPHQLKTKVEKWIKSHFPEITLIHSKDMLRSMQEADIVLSAGGQTLYELMRVGTPTISIGVAKNQEGNIQGLVNADALLFAGWLDDPALEKNVRECIKELLPLTNRQKLVKHLIDGQGVRRIVEALV